MRGEQLVDHVQREIRKMFVVDRVELLLLDETEQMRELERCRAMWFEQKLKTADKVVQVGHVRKHVVGGHQVGRFPGSAEPARRLGAEKRDFGGNALVMRHLGDVRRRLDAEHADAALLEILQQIAVVTGDLDDQRSGIEPVAFNHAPGIVAAMVEPELRVRREVEVIVENICSGRELLHLHEQATFADVDVQRVRRLAAVDVVGAEQRIGERRAAEVDEGPRQFGVAEAAAPGTCRALGQSFILTMQARASQPGALKSSSSRPCSIWRSRTFSRISCDCRKLLSANEIARKPALSAAIADSSDWRGWWSGASLRNRPKSTL